MWGECRWGVMCYCCCRVSEKRGGVLQLDRQGTTSRSGLNLEALLDSNYLKTGSGKIKIMGKE